jgi:hypothetical protein
MIDEAVIEQCLMCKLFFHKTEFNKVVLFESPIDFYVCNLCLEKYPTINKFIPPKDKISN